MLSQIVLIIVDGWLNHQKHISQWLPEVDFEETLYVFLCQNGKIEKKNRKWVNHQEYQPGWQVNGKKKISIQPIHWRTGHIELCQLPESQGPTRSPDGFAGVAKKNAGWISDNTPILHSSYMVLHDLTWSYIVVHGLTWSYMILHGLT